METIFRRAAGFIIVLAAALAQSAHLFFVWGVNPNLVAVAILALAYFEKDFFVLWFLAAASLILILPYSFGLWDSAVFLIALGAVISAKVFFVRRGAKSIPVLVIIFTPLFYVLLAPNFVFENPFAILLESLLNATWGSAFAFFFWLLFSYGTRSLAR